MPRRHRLVAARRPLLLVLALGALAACAPERPRRPNILFVFSDDHAAHAIGAYDSRINETPNIDRLASEGLVFRNAFVTNSICAPSRATILTGKYGHLTGVMTNREPLHSTEVTFPKLLQAAGYQTAIIGKWHLKSRPEGFDHYEVLRGQGPYYNPWLFSQDDSAQYRGYTTDIITDRALDWLRNARDPVPDRRLAKLSVASTRRLARRLSSAAGGPASASRATPGRLAPPRA